MCVEAFSDFPPLGRFAVRDMRQVYNIFINFFNLFMMVNLSGLKTDAQLSHNTETQMSSTKTRNKVNKNVNMYFLDRRCRCHQGYYP